MRHDAKYTCFDYTSLAALSDLRTELWRHLFQKLEQQQAEFLAKEAAFRSKEYIWPRDPLHTWSRLWEYPYAFHNIENWRRQLPRDGRPVVVDLGSGVTFFPYAVARLGCDVVCTDIDPICELDYRRANDVVHSEPGRVAFRLTGGNQLPFANAEADLVYCISVIEHIPDFRNTVIEVHRILKPGGRFILTVDLDLRGDQQLGIEEYSELHAVLGEYFEAASPIRIPHHADVLTSENGLVQPRLRPLWRVPPFLIKQWFIKPLLGRRPAPLVPLHCAVQGILLRKR